MDFKGGDKAKIILGADNVAVVTGFESHTLGYCVRIKFDNTEREMLVYEDEPLYANDLELTRIRTVYEGIKQKDYPVHS